MTTSSTSPPSSANRPLPASPVAVGTPAVRAWWTVRAHGDQRLLRHAAAAAPPVPGDRVVRALTQVHGAGVVVVGDGPLPEGAERFALGAGGAAPEGDALVATDATSCLAVLTADCGALALGSPEGVHGAVHAGWRGLLAGVVQAAVAVMRALGASEVSAVSGPCIHPCCYEFSAPELDAVAGRYGDAVRAETAAGAAALDLPAAMRVALEESDVRLGAELGPCTACGGESYSFRGRRDEARQALLVWRDGDW